MLNIALSQSMPGYIKWLSNYNAIVVNRNTLLREENFSAKNKSQIEAWSLILANYAADIYMARKDYISRLEYYINLYINEMTRGAESVSLRYRCDIDDKEATKEKVIQDYTSLLLNNIEKEKNAKATLYGIHRDDIIIKLNGVNSRNFTSQGQQRSIALAIKLAEGEISRDLMGEYPVFLFDDVLSELDDSRKNYVLNALENRQIIITSCEKDLFCDDREIRKIYVEKGKYTILQ